MINLCVCDFIPQNKILKYVLATTITYVIVKYIIKFNIKNDKLIYMLVLGGMIVYLFNDKKKELLDNIINKKNNENNEKINDDSGIKDNKENSEEDNEESTESSSTSSSSNINESLEIFDPLESADTMSYSSLVNYKTEKYDRIHNEFQNTINKENIDIIGNNRGPIHPNTLSF